MIKLVFLALMLLGLSGCAVAGAWESSMHPDPCAGKPYSVCMS